MRYFLPLLLSQLLYSIVFSVTINVPADQPTIQSGIDAASPGDTVLVASGTYQGDGNRDIDFGGKQLVLKSIEGPLVTILDCQGTRSDPHKGFNFHSGENMNSAVDGFTVMNGWGAVLCENGSSPQIRNCVFLHNRQKVIQCEASSPHIENCTIALNSGSLSGVAISTTLGSHPTFLACIVAFNLGDIPIRCNDSSSITMNCSVVFGNSAGDWGNCVSNQANINGNFSENPLFCDRFNDQLRLRSESPCIATNNSCGVTIGAFGVDESCVSCCLGVTGNIDNDPADIVDIADLTFLIDHLFINFPPLVCKEEGNVDGDPAGIVDIADLTFLIDHLFINFPPTADCQ